MHGVERWPVPCLWASEPNRTRHGRVAQPCMRRGIAIKSGSPTARKIDSDEAGWHRSPSVGEIFVCVRHAQPQPLARSRRRRPHPARRGVRGPARAAPSCALLALLPYRRTHSRDTLSLRAYARSPTPRQDAYRSRCVRTGLPRADHVEPPGVAIHRRDEIDVGRPHRLLGQARFH